MEKPMTEIFSHNLRNALYMKGMTQAELAKAVKTTERFLFDNIEEDFKVNVTLKPKKKENPKKYRDRLKRLNNIYLMGNISESDYKKEAEILQKKIAELSKQEQPKTKSFEKGWKDLYETLTEENKRSFWRSLIKGVEVDENGQPIKILY